MLTEALVQRGHEVTLFATGDSRTSARLVACVPQALGFEHLYESGAAHVAMLAQVYRRADEFDVIHSHVDYHALPFAAESETPTVITLHGALDTPGYPEALTAFPDLPYISISNSQRTPLPQLNWAATIYHGVDVRSYPFSERPGEYLLFVGRISPEKAPERAIAIARKCGIPLKIAAKVDPKDRAYFERAVKPLLDDPLIEFLGAVNEQRKRSLMRDALALLAPINWAEPFGLVYIEALACGLPVLTCPLGAAPEILRDGVTGFMRESDDELAEAALRVNEVSRAGCRAWVERHFDISQMTDNYLDAYQSVIDAWRRQRALDKLADASLVAPLADDVILPPEQVVSP
jgi:glycosyltransferase involved in cell wall biosynthesis